MYYVEQSAYKEWIGKDGNNQCPQVSRACLEVRSSLLTKSCQRGERPECDNHKAAADKHVRWGGLEVTGVGACTCARHSFFLPRGLVDYYKGERYVCKFTASTILGLPTNTI